MQPNGFKRSSNTHSYEQFYQNFEDFFKNSQEQYNNYQRQRQQQQQQQQQQGWSYEDFFNGGKSGMTRQEAYKILGLK